MIENIMQAFPAHQNSSGYGLPNFFYKEEVDFPDQELKSFVSF